MKFSLARFACQLNVGALHKETHPRNGVKKEVDIIKQIDRDKVRAVPYSNYLLSMGMCRLMCRSGSRFTLHQRLYNQGMSPSHRPLKPSEVRDDQP